MPLNEYSVPACNNLNIILLVPYLEKAEASKFIFYIIEKAVKR